MSELRDKVANLIRNYDPEWDIAEKLAAQVIELARKCRCGEEAYYCSECAQEAFTPYD